MHFVAHHFHPLHFADAHFAGEEVSAAMPTAVGKLTALDAHGRPAGGIAHTFWMIDIPGDAGRSAGGSFELLSAAVTGAVRGAFIQGGRYVARREPDGRKRGFTVPIFGAGALAEFDLPELILYGPDAD